MSSSIPSGTQLSTAEKLTGLPRSVKRVLVATTDSVVLPVAWLLGLFVAAVDGVPPTAIPMAMLSTIAAGVVAFRVFGMHRAVIRFMGPRMLVLMVRSITLCVVLAGLFQWLVLGLVLPPRFHLVFWSFAVLGVGGVRFIVKMYLDRQRRPGRRVAIYGAGGAGARLAAALVGGQEFDPVAFIDDNMALRGSAINGIEVHAASDLKELVREMNISQVLLAIPSASRRRRREVLLELEGLGVHVQTMPNFSDLIEGVARVDDIREVDVEDLLGRDSVPPNPRLLDACISGKVVLVTGAGGSIGSELCRQIIRQGPSKLLLFEMSELALYTIDRELRQIAAREKFECEIIGLVGTCTDRVRMRALMTEFGVQTVYHAAAYKHVPIVERNVIEGVVNNVFGTLETAKAADDADVEIFVLISTDKAVGPTNVMGATKRMAELVLQGLNAQGSNCKYSMVRFGNVLASSGSVVPLFRDQIAKGGPVTVTHPEIIRYFMTIPEAALLVIQAGSMAAGGDVFVLDMGNPVKIDDLARRMISLMGLTVQSEETPDGDIAITYTGLRPAEKLYEELLIGNNVMGTEHPRIMRAEEEMLTWEALTDLIGKVRAASGDMDCGRVRALLLEGVSGYAPTADLIDYLWVARSEAKKKTPATVTELPRR